MPGWDFWRSLRPVFRRPLAYQPFIIFGFAVSAFAWAATAFVVCAARLAAVVAGMSAFVGGILLCLLGYGWLGAPVGVAGLVASRLAA
jgi:hypothetical protein